MLCDVLQSEAITKQSCDALVDTAAQRQCFVLTRGDSDALGMASVQQTSLILTCEVQDNREMEYRRVGNRRLLMDDTGN